MTDEKKGIISMSTEGRKFPPPASFTEKAHIKSIEQYQEMYDRSIKDPDGFWGEMAENLHWFKKWDKVQDSNFDEPKIQWFVGGKINVAYNCLDRHLGTERENKAAIIWQGEPEEDSRTYTYKELHREVCKFANVLKDKGVKKGDRVAIYLPMIPELAVAMLACARIGAIHSIVFGGFSAEALRDRILDSECKTLITSDGSFRSGKTIPLKKNADAAVAECPCVENVIVVQRTKSDVTLQEGKEYWWHDLMEGASEDCPAEEMDAEDPLFILYTSGSTGKPKGVLHTTGGYMVYTSLTHQ
ncbi:MAG: acetyl-coenzyme A synthetase, partial [Planctomycetota bacterium]